MLESFGPEHAAMPRLSFPFAVGIALLLISPVASALGFGPSRNQTTLGQHLDFSASVLLDADEALPRDCVRAEVVAGDYPLAPRHVRAVLEATRNPAERIVRVTSSIAIDEPVVSLDISIGCGSRIARRFVAFIDPPALRLAEASAPSESVPLPSSGGGGTQVAMLADVARQADASRRRGGESRADDVERPPRPARRPSSASAAISVARVAAAVVPAKPKRQLAASRRSEPKTRAALVAPARGAGARLQLDPPRILVAQQRPAVQLTAATPTAGLLAPAVALASTVPTPSAAPAATPPNPPVTLGRAATDPLLAQVAAAAAAASGASTPAGAEPDTVRALQDEMARMRADSEKTRETVAALQAKVRQAEEGRYRNALVYVLVATTLLGVLAAALLWWLRPRQRRRARWFDAQASQQARAAARAGPSSAAGLASQPAPLSRPAPLPPPIAKTPSQAAPLRPPAAAPATTSSSGFSTRSASLLTTTQHSSIGGLEVTTVLGPELSRSSAEPFDHGGATLRGGGELTMEELIDLEQQAEFFVILGQDEAAMTLLENYVDHGGKSPLPYLQLLEIHQRRDDRDAYENIRHAFNERFNANAPDWNMRLQGGRGLEDYPQTIAMLQSLWPTPLSAMHALDGLLFRRDAVEETFDFPAYRELLLLYSMARELSENVETDSGSIDLFLPLEDAPVDPIRAMERTAPLAVDLDVSQWPEDAAMSDLLSRPKPSGRRGAA